MNSNSYAVQKIIIEELLYRLQNLGNYSNTVQNWWRDPHIRNRRENPETDQYKYLQLTFDKNAKAMIMEDGQSFQEMVLKHMDINSQKK